MECKSRRMIHKRKNNYLEMVSITTGTAMDLGVKIKKALEKKGIDPQAYGDS